MVLIDAGDGVPDPNPGAVALHLLGDVDAVTLRCYTKAMALAWQERSGPLAQGWARIPLAPGDLARLPNGLYYLTLTPTRGAATGRARLVKIYLVR